MFSDFSVQGLLFGGPRGHRTGETPDDLAPGILGQGRSTSTASLGMEKMAC